MGHFGCVPLTRHTRHTFLFCDVHHVKIKQINISRTRNIWKCGSTNKFKTKPLPLYFLPFYHYCQSFTNCVQPNSDLTLNNLPPHLLCDRGLQPLSLDQKTVKDLFTWLLKYFFQHTSPVCLDPLTLAVSVFCSTCWTTRRNYYAFLSSSLIFHPFNNCLLL